MNKDKPKLDCLKQAITDLEKTLQNFIDEPIDELTLTRITQVCIKCFQCVQSDGYIERVDITKIVVLCDIMSCREKGIIEFNPYTLSLFSKLHGEIDLLSIKE